MEQKKSLPMPVCFKNAFIHGYNPYFPKDCKLSVIICLVGLDFMGQDLKI